MKVAIIAKIAVVALLIVAAVPAVVMASGGNGKGEVSGGPIPLKEAKLNIEHNATDNDTGFQGAIDSEGWKKLTVTGPDGTVLSFTGRGELAELGLTELFFETVEPANVDVPIDEMLDKLPADNYRISGPSMENGEGSGKTAGTAWLTHNIPAGPELLSPAPGATVPTTGWSSTGARSPRQSRVTASISSATS